MNRHDRELIQATIKETIRQLKREGLLRSVTDMAYREATALLRKFYAEEGKKNEAVSKALKQLEEDPYFKILPMYFGYGYTIEEIAEEYGVEVSTISRNKKRLSVKLYELSGQ